MNSNKWDFIPAETFCIKVTDGTHDSPKRVESGKKLITSKHMNEFNLDFQNAYMISNEDFEQINQRSKVDQYDLIFSMIGTVGNVYLEKDNKIDYVVKNVGIFKNKNKLDALWLFYYLKSNLAKEYLYSHLNGSTQQYITLDSLRKYPILNPNLNTKKQIVKILSSLDDKIELNQKINMNLEQLAQTLYKRWFVDFEFPNEKGLPYQSSGGEMVESELGLIPKGWEVNKLGDRFNFIGGFSFKGNRGLNSGKYKIITIKNVQDGKLDLSSFTLIDEYPEKIKSNQILAKGDILLSLTGNVGRICIVNQDNCLLNQRVEKIEPKNNKLRGYLYIYLRNIDTFNKMLSLSKGSAQQNLSPIEVSNIKVAINEKEAFLFETFSSIIEQILNGQIETAYLEKLRDELLPKLMSGEIEVPVREN